MTLREVLEKVKAIIGEEIELEEQGTARDKLIDSAISIYDELVNDYVHLKAEEKVEFEDGICYFSSFTNKVKDILQIKQNGVNLDYEMFPLFVRCPRFSGVADAKYIFIPPVPALDDTLALPPRFSLHMLACGVASEYFYRSGMVDEALYYRNRYEYSLNNSQVRLRKINLKADRLI